MFPQHPALTPEPRPQHPGAGARETRIPPPTCTDEVFGKCRGPAALAWPHRVVTLDTVLYELLTHILRADLLHWPGGHRELHVLDTWHAQLPVTYSRTKPVLTLTDAHIVASHHREPRRVPTVGQEEFDEAVRQGICTHDDVRTVIQLALATEEVRDSVLTFVRTTMRSLIVDEVFDANTLDLDLIDIAARAGIAITLVGDPWQALYAFRGARPELIPELIGRHAFTQCDLTASFRWRSAGQEALARQLRSGESTIVDPGLATEVDVVLARDWKTLWDTDPHVLPMALKSASGQFQEAACTLLLNEMTRRAFGTDAVFLHEATTTLGIADDHALNELRPELQNVLDLLAGGTEIDNARICLNKTIAAATGLTAPRKHRTHLERLEKLRARLRVPQGKLVPGLTCHQAKGREWDTVGVRLTEVDGAQLLAGLRADHEHHRAIYVALTRARARTVAL